MTATIEAIGQVNGTVTLKGPQGNSRTIKARDPKNLQRVHVGDLVDLTFTEAVAVRRPSPKICVKFEPMRIIYGLDGETLPLISDLGYLPA